MRHPSTTYIRISHIAGRWCVLRSSRRVVRCLVKNGETNWSTAWAPPVCAAATAGARSCGSRTSRTCSWSPNAWAASSTARTARPPPPMGSQRTATRERCGMASRSSSSRLVLSSVSGNACPVIFPPGRAQLATAPIVTGSCMAATTMGRVVVACWAARTAGGPAVTRISTGSPTNSAARAGKRSKCPSAHRDARAMV
jgi:hypothetical protein